ncbi:DUF302 domain-containing protein [Fictibacillus nanhaiensis]|uniref:DUF302 domain-containing protein n=1 Tax=Fictibacillus nanhaiensis TaxID=742169 RepID=UPI001C96D177|nr:DUF302 domain-containing protein [Fictibacillus nanhaiensis]MBY6038073.1 DUF302 domain-containing protein [Fictibacillus nanhaiensis]
MFHYTVETTMTMEEAALKLEEQLKEEKFGVLWQFNVKEKLQEKGLDYNDDFLILEVCNPQEAMEVLTQNKMIGYFLPCKMVLYSEEGKTKIGMPKPTEFVKLLKDQDLEQKAKDIEERLMACMDKTV